MRSRRAKRRLEQQKRSENASQIAACTPLPVRVEAADLSTMDASTGQTGTSEGECASEGDATPRVVCSQQGDMIGWCGVAKASEAEFAEEESASPEYSFHSVPVTDASAEVYEGVEDRRWGAETLLGVLPGEGFPPPFETATYTGDGEFELHFRAEDMYGASHESNANGEEGDGEWGSCVGGSSFAPFLFLNEEQ
ncbi:unnamed protein product [Agarophyton chilense]